MPRRQRQGWRRARDEQSDLSRIIDDASMRRVIANGVAGTAMPPFAQSAGGSLTDHQIDLLIAGIRTNWAGTADAAAGAPPYSSSDGGRFESWRASVCDELSIVSWRRWQERNGRLDRRSFVPRARQQPVPAHDCDRRTPRPRPSRLEERRRRTAAHVATGFRRRRMARLETSRVTAGSEQLKWNLKQLRAAVFYSASE